MPLVLTQHASRDLNRYLDREWVIYHFPKQYLPLVKRVVVEGGDRRFLYQRPTKGASPQEAGKYFGFGFVSDPYSENAPRDTFFLDIIDPQPIQPVSLRDVSGVYYETGKPDPMMLLGRSIRYIDPMPYFAILAAGKAYSAIPEPFDVQESGLFAPVAIPTDPFRPLHEVPLGTGYVPQQSGVPDRYESAALHERARSDHQSILTAIVNNVEARGGVCFYNNNVDLFAKLGERRFLIEAKSLTRQTSAVNRMRFGIGQLMDYSVRYRAELQGAEPVLAFGAQPARDVSWIETILQENRIAFVAQLGGGIVPRNALGEALPFC